MKLIDADTLDDYLGKWADDFYENPENSDADFMDGYCMTMNRIQSSAVPTVDAIPVEWIKDKIALMNRTQEVQSSTTLNLLLIRWRWEKENQNDQTD